MALDNAKAAAREMKGAVQSEVDGRKDAIRRYGALAVETSQTFARENPLQAIFIAAAAGAVLIALLVIVAND